jgi:hypothetical protein
MFRYRQIIGLLENILHEIRLIRKLLAPKPIQSFTITPGGIMALLPIAPGFTPGFTATPTPSDSVPSTAPAWTSSDTTNAPVTASADGLTATVAIPASAVVGTVFTLTVSYTNADGTVATGTANFTIVAPPSPDITSFTITQTT